MKCKQCNKIIDKNKVYCNELCEVRFNTKSARNCLICNKFIGIYSSDSNKKTCSNKCRGLLRKKETQVENICKQCNKKFYTSSSRKKSLCSHECRASYTSTREHIEWRVQLASQAMIDKYGSHYFNTDDFIKKAKQTKVNKYGDENYVNVKKAKQTKLEKYGDENYNNQEKLKETLLNRYGVKNYNQSIDFKQTFYQKVIDRVSEEYIPNFTFEDYSGVSDNKYSFTCRTCDNVFDYSIDNGRFPLCPVCNVLTKEESEVYEFIKSILPDEVLVRTRDVINPLELDIYIPSKKIAVELNGVFWHSELSGKPKNYHINKTKLCNNLGIELIHIYDQEWKSKTDIIKSILQNKLSPILNNKVYARKCSIKEIDTQLCNDFLTENHIQGYAHSSVRLGLFHGDELVQVLTFSKSRFSKKYEYEMVRFCSKKYHTIIGGLAKLFNYFIKTTNPSSIITFADRRFFTGVSYERLGFSLASHTPPNYYYFTIPSKLESRINYQKHRLKDKLKCYDEKLTEWENMKNNGYDRIWDCGNYKFEWKRNLS